MNFPSKGTAIRTNKGLGVVVGRKGNGLLVKLNSGRIAKMVKRERE